MVNHDVKEFFKNSRIVNKKFVVLGPEKFFEALAPWKTWKEEQGFQVKLVSLKFRSNLKRN